MNLVPVWQKFTHDNWLESQKKNHCLYVFHHEDDGDKPFYIGKAKHFGAKQDDGYKGSARYNAGYTHLIEGLLRSGFTLYCSGQVKLYTRKRTFYAANFSAALGDR
jgi:hypothetical protein